MPGVALVQLKSELQRIKTRYSVTSLGESSKKALELQSWATFGPFLSNRNCATPPAHPPGRDESTALTRMGVPAGLEAVPSESSLLSAMSVTLMTMCVPLS